MTFELPILDLEVVQQPFPFIHTFDFFSSDYFNRLLAEFPTDNSYRSVQISQGGRQDLGRWNPEFKRFISQSESWQQFYEYTQSTTFIEQVLAKFSDAIQMQSCIDTEHWQASNAVLGYEGRFRRRFRNWSQQSNLALLMNKLLGDQLAVSFSINRSRGGYSSPPHIDTRHKLAVILYYLAEPEGTETGELELHQREQSNDYLSSDLRDGFADQAVKLKRFRQLPVPPNSGILFLNNKEAWHSAQQRVPESSAVPSWDRKFVYISIAEKRLENIWRDS